MTCRFHDCERLVFTKKSGLCQSHYLMLKNGEPLRPIRNLLGPEEKTARLRKFGFEPLVAYPGSDKPWLCKCKNGHEVPVVFDRLSINNEPCKRCRHPSLLSTNPELLEIWDDVKNSPVLFSSVSKGSEIECYWKCPHGHSFTALPSTMVRNPRPGCGVCSGHQVLYGFNDLASQASTLLNRWDHSKNQVAPESVYVASQKKYWFFCSNGHSILRSPYELKRAQLKGRNGCKYCANLECLPGWNDLVTVAPALAKEYDAADNSVSANELCAFAGEKVSWKCPIPSHPIYRMSPQSRVRRGSSCRICSKKFIQEGVNDVLTKFPWLSDKWSKQNQIPLSALCNLAKSDSQSKFLWMCPDFGHDYKASVDSLVRGKKCSVCAGLQILVGFNDLKSSPVGLEYDQSKTVLFREELGWGPSNSLDPETIFAGTRKRAYWTCRKNPRHSWPALISGRTRKENPTGCPFCSGLLVDQGVNDIRTRFPELVPEWSRLNELSPDLVSFGSNKEYFWICPTGHRDYLASPANRCQEKGTGCPDCNTGGFETSKSAYLYFIQHRELASYKIGIANSDSKPNRLNVWKSLGWEEIGKWESHDGRQIRAVEQYVLKNVIRKELGLPQSLSKEDMKIGSGQKETFAMIPQIQNAVCDAIRSALAKTSQ